MVSVYRGGGGGRERKGGLRRTKVRNRRFERKLERKRKEEYHYILESS